MTNNTNDPNEPGDVDIDTQEDFDKEPQQKASLKDTWDNNPMLKIAAVVVVVGALAGGYLMLFGGETDTNISRMGPGTTIKNKAGATNLDIEYEEAIKKENEVRATAAEKGAGSSMPIPIGRPNEDALSIPPAQKAEAGDPLQEWRAKAEARRLSLESESAPPEEEVQAPDIVPMVQPIRPQPTMKLDPQAAKALTQQMQAIIATQAPKPATRARVTKSPNLWIRKKKADARALAEKNSSEGEGGVGGTKVASAGGGTKSASGAPGTKSAAAKAELIVPAGNIAYAQLLNDLNSDIKGPALAQIMSGPFEGGRAMGEFTKQDEYLTLTFRRIIKDGVAYSINGIALNEETTLGAHQSDVDHHYFARVILPMAAQFLTGYTAAASETGTTVTQTSGGGQTQETPPPDPKQQLMEGANAAAGTLAGIITEDSDRPITIYVNRGTTMGILFMDSVTTSNASQ